MNGAKVIGLILSVLGAILDFASAYMILRNSLMTTNEMGTMITAYNTPGIIWSAALFVLGGLLIVTSLSSFSSWGMYRMSVFGILMVIYGTIMLFLGGAMYLHVTPMMNGYLLSSLGMFIVGALMMVNGLMMRRTKSSAMS